MFALLNTADNKYNTILNKFMSSIPNHHVQFVIKKCCGFEELIIVPRNATLYDFQRILINYVGVELYQHIYYRSLSNWSLIYLKDIAQNVSETITILDVIKEIQIAYPVSVCPYAVYELWYDYECVCYKNYDNPYDNLYEQYQVEPALEHMEVSSQEQDTNNQEEQTADTNSVVSSLSSNVPAHFQLEPLIHPDVFNEIDIPPPPPLKRGHTSIRFHESYSNEQSNILKDHCGV